MLNGVLFNDTAAPEKKPVPFTVNVNAGPPEVTVAGEMLVITGTGGTIVKVTLLDACPDGLDKLICADPGCATSAAETAAVTCVPLAKVVASGAPFNDTTAPVRKPVPFTVNVNAGLPAIALDGDMLLITGVGAAIVKDSALETRLPVPTVTDADPACAIKAALTAAVN